MSKNSINVSRRRLLLGAVQGTGMLLLSGCEKMFNGLQENKTFLALLESAEEASQGVQRLLTGRHKLAKEFTEHDISHTFKVNGNPPVSMDYQTGATKGWASWRLEVSGLIKQPTRFSLDELRSFPPRSQITRHDCVEGWSAIAKWKGVPLAEIVRRAQPRLEAKYVVFHCMDADGDGASYYESLDLVDANHPQTILAYEMNDRVLPIKHGAPLRLRVENQLGYKQAKYIQKVEFVSDFKNIQKGKGGYWEDQGYEWYAGI